MDFLFFDTDKKLSSAAQENAVFEDRTTWMTEFSRNSWQRLH